MYPSKSLLPNPIAKFLSSFLAAFVAIFLSFALIGHAEANSKYASIVVDANTGKTLHASSSNSQRYPASLTKMMTLYLLFEAMHEGKVTKDTRIVMSRHAAGMAPSKLGIPAGNSISAEDAILALVTKSANDVAAAVGEHLGGSETNFARMMTRKARQLGMSDTTYRNASGLPNSGQVTTAHDQAILGMALEEHFPREFKYFSTRSFKFGRAQFRNHNRLLGRVKGVDGIKTGYISASGFNLVTTVNTGGRSIVVVVFGGRTGASRDAEVKRLIEAYLPKASTRDRGPLIAREQSLPFNHLATTIASFKPADLPLPVPAARNTVEVASARPVVAPARAEVPNSMPAPERFGSNVAAPAPRPSAPIVTGRQPEVIAAYAPEKNVDTVTTASTPKEARSGWVIQIASLPSEQEAVAYLRRAQDKAGSVLDQRDPFVERFVKNGTTYHRARFAGFNSKSAAWAACNALKKYDYSCLAFDNS